MPSIRTTHRRPRLKPRRELPDIYSTQSWTHGVLNGAIVGAVLVVAALVLLAPFVR